MDGTIKQRLAPWLDKLKRYRYAGLVILLGAVLMLLPGRNGQQAAGPAAVPAAAEPVQQADLCRQMEQILGQIDGVGTVSCLITCREGARTVYQTDTIQSGGGEVRVSTVLVSSGSGTEAAVVAGQTAPVYQGVVVVCDGADSARLRLEITQAVSALTGLSSDKIAVVKRKGNS